MSYILAGTTLSKGPYTIEEDNSTLMAQQRTLDGSVNRDYFGTNKRVWKLDYKTTNVTLYNTINSIYSTYLSTGAAVTWQSTETNYTFSTSVHVDLQVRNFNVRGSDYLSDFTLILTEA